MLTKDLLDVSSKGDLFSGLTPNNSRCFSLGKLASGTKVETTETLPDESQLGNIDNETASKLVKASSGDKSFILGKCTTDKCFKFLALRRFVWNSWSHF